MVGLPEKVYNQAKLVGSPLYFEINTLLEEEGKKRKTDFATDYTETIYYSNIT